MPTFNELLNKQLRKFYKTPNSRIPWTYHMFKKYSEEVGDENFTTTVKFHLRSYTRSTQDIPWTKELFRKLSAKAKDGLLANINLILRNYSNNTSGIPWSYNMIERSVDDLEKFLPLPAIGDLVNGAIVFAIRRNYYENYALAVSLEDIAAIQWSNGSLDEVGGTSTEFFSGEVNTDAIVAAQGPIETDYAAGAAKNYGSDIWFLPSIDTLVRLRDIDNVLIRDAITANGGTDPGDGWEYYWSSSEDGNETDQAYTSYPVNSGRDRELKSRQNLVRPVHKVTGFANTVVAGEKLSVIFNSTLDCYITNYSGIGGTIDWGDGTTDPLPTSNYESKSYNESSLYYNATVTTDSYIADWYDYGNYGIFEDSTGLIEVIDWFDASEMTSLKGAFAACPNLLSVPFIDTSKVTNFQSMFNGCASLITVPPYDVSSGTDFTDMFLGCSALTKGRLNGTRYSIDYASCTVLTTAAINDIFEGLGVADGAQTITIPAGKGQTDSIATAKGWTIAEV